jgi:uncharacterized protein (DUF58 family)
MQTLQDRPLRLAHDPYFKHLWRLFIWIINLRLVPFWHERFRDPITVPFRYFFYDGLTRTGKVLLLLALFVNFASYISPQIFPISGASLLFTLLFTSYLISLSARPKIKLERRAPIVATAGEKFISSITLTNLSTRTLKNFALREMKGMPVKWPSESELDYRGQLLPQETTVMRSGWIPRRRGVIHLWGIVIQSYFPLFLGRTLQRLHAQHSVYVLPLVFGQRVPCLRRLAASAQQNCQAGFASGRHRQPHEYLDSREFLVGDSLNRIDHRASARRGQLMTRIYGGSHVAPSAQIHFICDLSLSKYELWQPRPRNPEVLDKRLAAMVAIYQQALGEKLELGHWYVGGAWGSMGHEIEFFKQTTVVAPTRTFEAPDSVPIEDGVYCVIIGCWSEPLAERIAAWSAKGATILVFMVPESKAQVGTLPNEPGWLEFEFSS